MFHIFNDILKGSKILESVEQRNIGRGGSENKRYYFVSYNGCFQVKKNMVSRMKTFYKRPLCCCRYLTKRSSVRSCNSLFICRFTYLAKFAAKQFALFDKKSLQECNFLKISIFYVTKFDFICRISIVVIKLSRIRIKNYFRYISPNKCCR